jgi:NitT/TauT family transport system substrate-binding protein
MADHSAPAVAGRSRRPWNLIVAVLLAAIVLSTFAEGQKPDSVTFLTSFFLHNGGWTPLYAGVQKGIFKKHGIDLKIELGRGSASVATQLAGGAAQFAQIDLLSGVVAISKGAKITFVSTYYQKYIAGLCSMEGGKVIRSFEDLKDLKIGASAGDAFVQVLPALTTTKFNHVVIEPASYLPALLSGQVDAITVAVYNLPRQQANAARQGKKLACFFYGDHGVKLLSDTLATRNDVLQSNPDLVKRFVTAFAESMAWSVKNPEEAVGLYLGATPEIPAADRDIYLSTFKSVIGFYHDATSPDEWFVIPQAKVAYTVDVATRFFGAGKVAPTDVVDNKFAEGLPAEWRRMK